MRTWLRNRRRSLSDLIAANLARPNTAPPVDLLQILMGGRVMRWLRIKWDTAVIVAAGAMLALLTAPARRRARMGSWY